MSCRSSFNGSGECNFQMRLIFKWRNKNGQICVSDGRRAIILPSLPFPGCHWLCHCVLQRVLLPSNRPPGRPGRLICKLMHWEKALSLKLSTESVWLESDIIQSSILKFLWKGLNWNKDQVSYSDKNKPHPFMEKCAWHKASRGHKVRTLEEGWAPSLNGNSLPPKLPAAAVVIGGWSILVRSWLRILHPSLVWHSVGVLKLLSGNWHSSFPVQWRTLAFGNLGILPSLAILVVLGILNCHDHAWPLTPRPQLPRPKCNWWPHLLN